MAKRYHASKRARRSEHMGMERYERGPVRSHYRDEMGTPGYNARGPVPQVVHDHMDAMQRGEYYGSKEATKKLMQRDRAMIHEDRRAPSLLPQQVIERYWPTGGYHVGGVPNDLFNGVQIQLDEDGTDMRRELGPRKY